MTNSRPIVYIVDDEPGVRNSLSSLVRSVGLEARTFADGAEFLESAREDAPECLVVDVRMPGISGLDLQNRLSQSSFPIPVIFITGHGDASLRDVLMSAGASGFLNKPVRRDALLNEIYAAFKKNPAN